MIRLMVRGYIGNALIFKERVEVEREDDLDPLVKEQMDRLRPGITNSMVEIEFLDELDPKERFFRFGTDTRRMRNPIGVDLWKLKEP